ncbi:NAD(P)/FAD-dependent oxidoreductase [Pedobacter antarcticus]|uniref:NADH:ubiquinone reductase (non-electrogenic) n=2 Tax=Pedobacter antarcticus TaxID=34086 RepID=A0A081PJ91_9SPHI|nr:NAD(P)/FAD-dependent oxidoreductase [Pedobacter antarcticus]KEQ30764.1 NADH dehydrogenase [Pedobacter antarcticus 4BY]SDM42739.1 NADH dehydrogenase [Pedobacter antarcticus]SFE92080.1 NADH dehydrogenase [Pedobacter antarcticus]
MDQNKKRVLIIGGGFAGVNLAKQLAGHTNFEVILADKNNYNFFPPLIYQVATGYLESSNISYPFRKLLRGKDNIQFWMGELQEVFPEQNKVMFSTGEVSYDILVLATGCETNYFGMESVAKHAIPMKTLSDALQMRNTLLERLELASRTQDPAERKKLLTVVVAGGGPTGVEISGMFAEMKKHIIAKDYPELSGSGGEIYLVDGLPAVLTPMSEKSQQYTYNALLKMGVKVKLNMMVKDFVDDQVHFANGETITTKNLIWAAGVTAMVFKGVPAEAYGKGKRLQVDAFNLIQGTDNIYALGDTCIQLTDSNFPQGHPQLAQVAMQQADNLGKNLVRISKSEPKKPFAYHDRGSMAIIGRNKAVADLPKPKMFFSGFIAWLMWLFIHLISLINSRNQIKTLYNWMVAYFTRDQSLRMIVRPGANKELIVPPVSNKPVI